ncbi:MAG: hypothetical protein EOQ32_23475 [Mesorhizobium sp.]|nr:hypothetical protein EJ067_03985 [Mesorhizobium sp. M1D.F.Ca.ET.043.01.1.1]RWA88020.1 MAG: hypothetical protein EOQ32_23475 [Mesorhizobium sp.]RWE16138.1 MAG: hypothetical protein EOS61_07360 [Mesorhizobium sp.]
MPVDRTCILARGALWQAPTLHSFAPPSGLPTISPTRGEIGCHVRLRQSPQGAGTKRAAAG